MLIRLNKLLANASSGEPIIQTSDDYYIVYDGRDRVIPAEEIVINDVDFQYIAPLTDITITNVVGGTVAVVGDNIIFTSNLPAGSAAGFDYSFTNSLAETATGHVTMEILAKTLVPNVDYYDVYDGKTQAIPFSFILSNDEEVSEYQPLTIIDITNNVGGTVVIDYPGQRVLFTANGLPGSVAGFDYTVQNTLGETATGNVVVTILPITISATDDQLDVFSLEYRDVDAVYLLQNDFEQLHMRPIALVQIDAAVGGTVVEISPGILRFTSSGAPGATAGFDYTIENVLGHRSTGHVTMNVIAVPNTIVPAIDNYTMFDGYPITITSADMIANDYEVATYQPLVFERIDTVTGGTVVEISPGIFEVTNTAPPGESVIVNYVISNAYGYEAIGTANVLVKAVTLSPNDDNYVTYEQNDVTIIIDDILVNDTEVAALKPITFVQVDAVVGGTITQTATEIIFTATALPGATAYIDYTISNAVGHLKQARIIIDIISYTLNPLADTISVYRGYDEPFTANQLIANDTEVAELQPINLVSIQNAVNCTVTDLGNGNYTVYTDSLAGAGDVNFKYTLENSVGHQKSAIVTIDVNNITLIAPSPSVLVDLPELHTRVITSATLYGVGSNVESNPSFLPVSITEISNIVGGTVTLVGDTITIVADGLTAGNNITFDYTIVNAAGHSVVSSVTVPIAVPNISAVDDAGISTHKNIPVTIPFSVLLANDTDTDIATLEVINVFGGVDGLSSIDTVAETVTFAPDPDFVGLASFDYTIRNDLNQTSDATVSVNILEQALTAVTDDFGMWEEDVTMILTDAQLMTNDIDDPAYLPLTITAYDLTTDPADGLTITRDEVFKRFVFTADHLNATRTVTFNYTVTNSVGHESTASVNMFVDFVADSIPNIDVRDETFSVYLGHSVSVTTDLVISNDSEPDIVEQPISFDAVTNVVGGTVEIVGGTVIKFTSTGATSSDPAYVDYRVVNTIGHAAIGRITYNVLDTVISATDDTYNSYAGDSVSGTLTDLIANDTDDALFLPLTVVDFSSATQVVGNDWTIDIPLGTAEASVLSYQYTVQNTAGHQTTGNVLITVLASDLTATDDTYQRYESTITTVSKADLISNDIDNPANLPITFVSVQNLVGVGITDLGSELEIIVDAAPGTNASFDYIIQNALGHQDIATVTVNILDYVGSPDLDNFSEYHLDSGGILENDILEIFRDNPLGPYAEPITVTAVAPTDANLSVSLAGGIITYTSTGTIGNHIFNATVSDGVNTYILPITVTIIARTLVGQPDIVPMKLGASIDITASSLISNDTDIAANLPLTLVSVQSPVNGTVSLSGGIVTFDSTITDGVAVDHSFTYTVENAIGHQATVLVTLPSEPFTIVANPETFDVYEMDSITIQDSQLLVNDIDDPSNGALAVESYSNISTGTGVFTDNGGSVTIGAADTAGAGATYSYDYTIVNIYGHRTTSTVTINVMPIPFTMVPTADAATVYVGQSVNILYNDLLANDFEELAKKPLTIINVVNPVGGGVTFDATSVTFTPSVGVGVTAGFDYIVQNTIGQQAIVHVTVNVIDLTLQPFDDTLAIFTGYTKEIPFSLLLGNDVDVPANLPLEIVAVSNALGGTVNLLSDKIVYVSTATSADPAGFTYNVRNNKGHERPGTVTFNVTDAPVIVAGADTFAVRQGETLLILVADMILNDTSNNPPVQVTHVLNPYGGTMLFDGTTVTFNATALAGDPAGFEYRIIDQQGQEAFGQVFININELAPIDAYIYDTTLEALDQSTAYEPPSKEDVFNTWARIENDDYYPAPGPYGGDSDAWHYHPEDDRLHTTQNTDTSIGFLSTEQLSVYTLEATLFSGEKDNDLIGFLIAAKYDPALQKVHRLAVYRTANGADNWGINVHDWAVALNVNGFDATDVDLVINNSSVITEPSDNQWKRAGVTQVRVERDGYRFRLYTSPFNTTTIDAATLIEIDVRDYPELAWVGDEPHSYGFTAFSQKNAEWLDINLEGGIVADRIYDLEANVVWMWNPSTAAWEIDNTTTIADELGYPRTITNPDTGSVYRINYDKTITKIS